MIERIKLTMRKEFVDDVRVVQKEVVERKEVVVERRVQRKRPAEYVDVERIEYVDQPGPGVTIEEVTETFEREVVKIVDRIEYIDEEVEKIVEVEKVVEVPVEVHVQKERIVEEVVYEDTIVDVLRYVHVPVVQHVEVEVEELEFVETKVYSRDLILKEVVVEVPSETETIEKTVVVEVRCLRLHTRKASPFLRARSSSLYPPFSRLSTFATPPANPAPRNDVAGARGRDHSGGGGGAEGGGGGAGGDHCRHERAVQGHSVLQLRREEVLATRRLRAQGEVQGRRGGGASAGAAEHGEPERRPAEAEAHGGANAEHGGACRRARCILKLVDNILLFVHKKNLLGYSD